ncbi:MAG: protein kinase [Candidatus Obscuribacter sp.]|nr:protein kinase [Candidatus Obscuribacter sp.]
MSTGSTDTPQKRTSTHSFSAGDMVGDSYRVLSFIGEGAMGEVYRAKHEMMPREYALKVLNTNQITENSWRRFQIEAQAIARMNHPNVVVIYNLGVHAGRLPFYVMDLLSGESLFDRLNRVEQLSVAEALPLFIQVCDGLAYAHKKGIVHRDIKPHNIVVLSEPEASGALVKIVDFGIAKLAETKDPQNQQLTKMGEVFGTPYYMSPEQSMGQRVDGRSDIYSLGCTLFEALVSTPPFRGKSSTETMLLHQTAAPPTLAKASGGQTFPESVEFIVAKMLAKEPMERYQSMEAVKHDLELALQGKDLSVLPYMATSQRQNYDTTGGTTSNSATAGRTTSSPSAAGKTTARQTQPKLTPQEDSGQYTIPPNSSGLGLKLGIAATAVVLLAGATGAYFLLKPGSTEKLKLADKNHQQTDTALKTAPARAAQGAGVKPVTAKLKEEDDNSVGFGYNDLTSLTNSKEIGKYTEMMTGDKLNPNDPNCSIYQTTPYSKVVKQGKATILEFNFPEDACIGRLWRDDTAQKTMDNHQDAIGKVTYSPREKRYYHPSLAVEKYPQYLKRFQKGDLYGLLMSKMFQSTTVLEACATIPSIKSLNLDFCSGLPPSSAAIINKYQGLERLRLSHTNLDGALFAKHGTLSALQDFQFDKGKNVSPVLRELASINRLKTLSIANTELSSSDYENISKITELTSLNISGCRTSSKHLEQISKLKNLKHLAIAGVRIKDSDVKFLQRLPHLESLSLSVTPEIADSIQELKRQRPSLNVIQASD